MNVKGTTILVMLAFAIVLSAALAVPAMLLWNGCLVPAVPVLTEVSWLQMWGIAILVNLLTKTSVKFNQE